jgi:hypothetical protein
MHSAIGNAPISRLVGVPVLGPEVALAPQIGIVQHVHRAARVATAERSRDLHVEAGIVVPPVRDRIKNGKFRDYTEHTGTSYAWSRRAPLVTEIRTRRCRG